MFRSQTPALALAFAVALTGGAAALAEDFKVIHTFTGGDGAEPQAGLIEVGGLLYGTTSGGGSSACYAGCGPVFSLDPTTGAESVLHEFGSGSGSQPAAALINADGILYGTTSYGGTEGKGTVFSIDPGTGAEAVVYSFTRRHGPSLPLAALTKVGNRPFGTTFYGGDCGDGTGCSTVFSVDPATGAGKVVHSFGESGDGALPASAMIDVHGTLFGMTEGAACRAAPSAAARCSRLTRRPAPNGWCIPLRLATDSIRRPVSSTWTAPFMGPPALVAPEVMVP